MQVTFMVNIMTYFGSLSTVDFPQKQIISSWATTWIVESNL
jgi:hypothetical protein